MSDSADDFGEEEVSVTNYLPNVSTPIKKPAIAIRKRTIQLRGALRTLKAGGAKRELANPNKKVYLAEPEAEPVVMMNNPEQTDEESDDSFQDWANFECHYSEPLFKKQIG